MQTNPFRPPMPQHRGELQAAVDAANLLLVIAIGKLWGLVDYKGRINEKRCEAIIARGNTCGIRPRTPGPAK